MTSPGGKEKQRTPKGAYAALLLATLALAINFWAWSLLSPLGARLEQELSLGAMELSLLLAVPVIIGSLGRIVLGAAADRFGGRTVFIAASLAMLVPVFMLSVAQDYNQLLAAAFLLGIGGATFVIGVPYLSNWFPLHRRGFVLGLYSMGNAGTALAGLVTPGLDDLVGRRWTFLLVGLILVVVAIVLAIWAKNAPGWKPSRQSPVKSFLSAASSRVTWDLALLYVITFGALVAFGVYLPVLLKFAYGLSVADAAARAAGFVLLATLARPVGGWLSDKLGATRVVRVSLLAVAVLAGFAAYQPNLQLHTTAAYLGMAFALGCGNGAIIALVGKLSKPGTIGSVTGIVGAMGGLGGFVPPLILGFTYERTNSFGLALVMLALSALMVFWYIHLRFGAREYRQAVRTRRLRG